MSGLDPYKKFSVEIIEKNRGIFKFEKDKENFLEYCPSRGGLITNITLSSQEILYFDQERFFDGRKSVRGGIPILFPICGNLNESRLLFGTNYLNLKQHGFARDLEWKHEINYLQKSLRLSLSDSDFTWNYYPYSFSLLIDLILNKNSFDFQIIINNKSDSYMPVNFGLHPYFNISNFQNIKFVDYSINCQKGTY